jgi:hypothetical protein
MQITVKPFQLPQANLGVNFFSVQVAVIKTNEYSEFTTYKTPIHSAKAPEGLRFSQ